MNTYSKYCPGVYVAKCEEQHEKAVEYHEGVKSGKYPGEHSYTLSYAKKAVNDLAVKVSLATKLWG